MAGWVEHVGVTSTVARKGWVGEGTVHMCEMRGSLGEA